MGLVGGGTYSSGLAILLESEDVPVVITPGFDASFAETMHRDEVVAKRL